MMNVAKGKPIENPNHTHHQSTTMWASHYLSPPTPPLHHPLIPKSPLPFAVVSAKSQPQQDYLGGGLGRSILIQLKANSKPTNLTAVPKQQKQKKQLEETSRQISGSDVLFAMQKAAAAKKRKEAHKKNTKTKTVASAGRNREEEEKDGVDYSKPRPLCLNSDWGRRLDDLEMRLQDLSSKTI